jgi:chemotaxis protein methyltransferase CheR
MKYNLSDSEFSQVCEKIAAKMGLHFPIERWVMLGRNLSLAAREFGFHEMDGFIHWFLSQNLDQEQIKILASHLTISETYFWREPQVFAALTDFILPELFRSKNKEKVEELATKSRHSGRDKSIRIWSIGCSTGEEPYSLAIALHKTVPEITDWNISILASDINPRAIEKARWGIYGPWSFRNTPEWIRSKYFLDLEDRKYEIIPEIKNMVTFSCQSLTGDEIFSLTGHKIDIIFCRNVLMYFTPEWVNRISENIFNSLTDAGWFVVSSSELSSQVFPRFTAVNFPGAVLYNKHKNGAAHSLSSEVLIEKEIQPFNLSTFKPVQPIQPKMFVVEKLKSLKVEINECNPSTLQPFNSSTFTRHSLGEGGPSSVQQPLPPPEDSSATKIFAIRLLANQGYLSEALTLCNEAIESEKLVSGFYFIRASILQEMDRSPEAIASLKKSIYIDPDYVMGHFTLGNLFNQQGNTRNAKRHFKNVLDLLEKCTNDDIPSESEGLSVKYIREIILANMETIRTK